MTSMTYRLPHGEDRVARWTSVAFLRRRRHDGLFFRSF